MSKLYFRFKKKIEPLPSKTDPVPRPAVLNLGKLLSPSKHFTQIIWRPSWLSQIEGDIDSAHNSPPQYISIQSKVSNSTEARETWSR